MNHGPLVFLGVLAALATAWFGMIVQPQLQLGRAVPGTNMVETTALYPQARAGLAQQGLQVYRSLGCATCHTRQVRQDGMLVDVLLREAGTNTAAVIRAITRVRRELPDAEAERLLDRLPVTIQSGLVDPETAAASVKELTDAGARAQVLLRPQGPDIARGWGRGRTVAADFLYDQPALPGHVRLGPDLANIGARLPSPEWHYLHLYDPQAVNPKSVMPPHRFLFERRRVGAQPSADGIVRPSAAIGGTGEGMEIVPTAEARALVAFLLSLRSDVPLLERPVATGDEPDPETTDLPAAGDQPAVDSPAL